MQQYQRRCNELPATLSAAEK